MENNIEKYLSISENIRKILNENHININDILKLIDYISDYYFEELIEQNDDIKCSICYCVLKEPMFLKCGHKFCKKCINIHLNNFNNCPLCRYKINNKNDDLIEKKEFNEKLNELKFKCEWCNEIIKYSEYLKHKNNCPKGPKIKYECQNKIFNINSRYDNHHNIFIKCNKILNSNNIWDHIKNCALRKIKCNICSQNILNFNRQNHFLNECKIRIIEEKYIVPETYIGEIKNGKKEGYGILFNCYGEIYEGSFKDDKKNGYGKFKKISGEYEGNFENDKKHGIGVQKTIDYIYKGQFKEDIKHGYGELEFGNCLFEGEFKNDQIEGLGILKLPNLTFYKGKWLPYKSSNSFYTIQGDYAIIFDLLNIKIIKMENNKFDGYGKEYYIRTGFNESNYYFGQFKNGLKEGYGIEYSELFFSQKEKYEGYFSEDKRNGIGIYILEKEYKYEGEFRNNEKNGIGIYISEEG